VVSPASRNITECGETVDIYSIGALVV